MLTTVTRYAIVCLTVTVIGKIKKIIMVRYLSFFFLIVFNFTSAQSNNVEIHYKVKVDLKPNQKKETSSTFRAISNEIKNLSMILRVNNSLSSFKEEDYLDIDNKTKHLRKMAKLITGLKGEYFCDLENKLIIISKEFDGIDYNVKSNFNKFKWNLSNETKTIGGYKCLKASTIKKYKDRKGNNVNLNVVAWYSPDLPIPLGPKNYIGLPGLILELHEGKDFIHGITYYVSNINLKSKKEFQIEIPNKESFIDEKEFLEMTEKAYRNLLNSRN